MTARGADAQERRRADQTRLANLYPEGGLVVIDATQQMRK